MSLLSRIMSFIDTGRLRVISALIDKQLLPHIQTAITTAAASAGGIGEDGEETESAFSVQRSFGVLQELLNSFSSSVLTLAVNVGLLQPPENAESSVWF